MRVEAGIVPDLALHLARMAANGGFLGSKYRPQKRLETSIAAMIPAAFRGRLRLLLAPSGAVCVQFSPLPRRARRRGSRGAGTAAGGERTTGGCATRPAIAAFTTPPALRAAPSKCVFPRRWPVTEGSFTTIFVERGDVLLTPPAADGLLPGILRARLLADGTAIEAELSIADLEGGFFIGNALRGLMPARLRD